MQGVDHFDPSNLTALVLDDNHYERGISLDQLRAMGFGRAIGAANTMEAWEAVRLANPNVILMDWVDGAGGDGLEFARRVRKSDETPNRSVPMFMLTTRGAAADVERVRPLLQLMGKSIHHLGALGCGHAMKCLNNCVTAMTFAATSEALVAGKRYGLDPQAMVEVLNESTGGSWITRTHYHQRIFNRAFDDPFKLALMLKDVGIALQLAKDTGSPMPMAGLGQQLWRMADHSAGPGASVSELVRWVEGLSGTELTPGAGPRQGPGQGA